MKMLATQLSGDDQVQMLIAFFVAVVLVAAIIAGSCVAYYGTVVEKFLEARNEKRNIDLKKVAEANRHAEAMAKIEVSRFSNLEDALR